MHMRTLDRLPTLAKVLLLAVGLAGCVQPSGVRGTTTLSNTWMLGIERMHDDPEPQLPFTNRFIADLAAMPRTQVVFVGTDRNSFAFNAWSGDKLLVSPRLHAEGNCMTLNLYNLPVRPAAGNIRASDCPDAGGCRAGFGMRRSGGRAVLSNAGGPGIVGRRDVQCASTAAPSAGLASSSVSGRATKKLAAISISTSL